MSQKYLHPQLLLPPAEQYLSQVNLRDYLPSVLAMAFDTLPPPTQHPFTRSLGAPMSPGAVPWRHPLSEWGKI